MMKTSTLAALIAAGAVVAAAAGCATSNQQWHENCTVESKDILIGGSDGNTSRTKRLTTSCGSFNVEDAIEVGHFTSWDIWTQLDEGQTYDLFTGGPRIGWLSAFPIVLEVKPAA